MQYNRIPLNAIEYHAIACNTIKCHALLSNKIEYQWILANTKIPLKTMQYHWIPSNTITYNWIPCNTIEYHPIHYNPVCYPRCYIHLRWRFWWLLDAKLMVTSTDRQQGKLTAKTGQWIVVTIMLLHNPDAQDQTMQGFYNAKLKPREVRFVIF